MFCDNCVVKKGNQEIVYVKKNKECTKIFVYLSGHSFRVSQSQEF